MTIIIGHWLLVSWRLRRFNTLIHTAALTEKIEGLLEYVKDEYRAMHDGEERWMLQNGSWCLARVIPLDRRMVSFILKLVHVKKLSIHTLSTPLTFFLGCRL